MALAVVALPGYRSVPHAHHFSRGLEASVNDAPLGDLAVVTGCRGAAGGPRWDAEAVVVEDPW
jgi:hypothetical protein